MGRVSAILGTLDMVAKPNSAPTIVPCTDLVSTELANVLLVGRELTAVRELAQMTAHSMVVASTALAAVLSASEELIAPLGIAQMLALTTVSAKTVDASATLGTLVRIAVGAFALIIAPIAVFAATSPAAATLVTPASTVLSLRVLRIVLAMATAEMGHAIAHLAGKVKRVTKPLAAVIAMPTEFASTAHASACTAGKEQTAHKGSSVPTSVQATVAAEISPANVITGGWERIAHSVPALTVALIMASARTVLASARLDTLESIALRDHVPICAVVTVSVATGNVSATKDGLGLTAQ